MIVCSVCGFSLSRRPLTSANFHEESMFYPQLQNRQHLCMSVLRLSDMVSSHSRYFSIIVVSNLRGLYINDIGIWRWQMRLPHVVHKGIWDNILIDTIIISLIYICTGQNTVLRYSLSFLSVKKYSLKYTAIMIFMCYDQPLKNILMICFTPFHQGWFTVTGTITWQT